MAYRSVASDTAPNTTTIDILGSGLTGLQVGDVMIAGIAFRAASITSAPAGWTQFGPTQIMRTADGVSVVGRLTCYRKLAEAGDDSATFTWTLPTAQSHAGIIVALSGRNTSVPISDVEGFENTASLQTIDGPDVTAVEGDDIVAFAAITSAGNETFTTPAPLTERADIRETTGGDIGIVVGTDANVSAGAYAVGDFTTSLASGWQRMAAITVAVAVAAIPPQLRVFRAAARW
jgi:hypothetical protein